MVASWEEIEEAIVIQTPESDKLVLEDSRRITGPGLLWDHPGALIDILITDFDQNTVIDLAQKYARRMLDDVGWENSKIIIRSYDGGISVAISSTMDVLYSAVFVLEAIWHHCASELLNEKPHDYETMVTDLRDVISRETNPALMALMKAADEHGVDVISDDEEVSIGHGSGSKIYPVLEAPDPATIDWSEIHNVPVALITGTNGKTTSVRLSAAIARANNKVAGLTSTDFIRVGDDILDHGDYSGPGGARMLLRDTRLEVAFLEVARGGILRRGLPIRKARAALVTNVAADHLGQYGINTVPELATVKLAIHRALDDDGVFILNADDEFVVAESINISVNICWFSLDDNNPQILKNRQNGLLCAWMSGDNLVYFDGQNETIVIPVNDIPLTMGGAADYNIRNALGTICLARVMGTGFNAIRAGLSGFTNNPKDNPGRCNEFIIKGARVFIDFAHNPHSIAAVTTALGKVEGKRRFLMVGHAGDRSDEDIRGLTRGAFAFRPDYMIANENPEYLRGRELGEVSNIVRDESMKQGMPGDNVIMADSIPDGVAKALAEIQEGDVALLLVHTDRDEVFELIEKALNP